MIIAKTLLQHVKPPYKANWSTRRAKKVDMCVVL